MERRGLSYPETLFPGPVRTLAKKLVESLLVGSGLARLGSSLRRRDRLILCYHNVLPDGEAALGDASLHLSGQVFLHQLDMLTDVAEVVALEDLFRPAGASTRPRVAITFDDAYRGAVTTAVPALAARNLPATMFIAPGFVPDGAFWWDLVEPEGPVEGWRDSMLTTCAGDGQKVRLLAQERSWSERVLPSCIRVASEAELSEALELHEGLRFGSHSWSHPNLTRVGPDRLGEELRRSLEWIESRFPPARVSRWLSYPYGLANDAVMRAASAAGYSGGLLVSGGWLGRAAAGGFAVPRFNVPAGLSAQGFRIRLGGILTR